MHHSKAPQRGSQTGFRGVQFSDGRVRRRFAAPARKRALRECGHAPVEAGRGRLRFTRALGPGV
jgi:hypothetical protein